MSSEAAPDRQRRRRMNNKLFWSLIVAGVLAVLVPLVGLPVLMTYDSTHQTWIECTVTSAEAGSSAASTRGAATTQAIWIETSDCGELVLQWGVTKDNMDGTVAALHPGERYSFAVGEASAHLLGLLHLLRITPTVYTFETAY